MWSAAQAKANTEDSDHWSARVDSWAECLPGGAPAGHAVVTGHLKWPAVQELLCKCGRTSDWLS